MQVRIGLIKVDDVVKELVNYSRCLPAESSVLKWASPIAAFGDPYRAHIATLGLNPSNREFEDRKGNELRGQDRRFPTLNSLGIIDWKEATDSHIEEVATACRVYFERNPYRGWFNKLDSIIQATGASFYSRTCPAVHLDLVPFATKPKWANLPKAERELLLDGASFALGTLLRDTPIRLLILNGRSVVNTFRYLCDAELSAIEQPAWSLKQKNGRTVRGFSFRSVIHRINDTELPSEILLLGFNHNIQSSFGVSSNVQQSIGDWIAKSSKRWYTDS